MIKNVVFLLILLLFSCCSLKTERKVSEEITMARNDVDIKMVVLHHVNLVGIFTIVDVSCEEFERVFCDSMKKDTIVEPNEISLLETYIDNLKKNRFFIYKLNGYSMQTLFYIPFGYNGVLCG